MLYLLDKHDSQTDHDSYASDEVHVHVSIQLLKFLFAYSSWQFCFGVAEEWRANGLLSSGRHMVSLEMRRPHMWSMCFILRPCRSKIAEGESFHLVWESFCCELYVLQWCYRYCALPLFRDFV